MQRNVLILIIALVIVAACALIAAPALFGPPSATINSVTTDKDLYHSNEIMQIAVLVNSQGDVSNSTLRFRGIQDQHGDYQLDKEIPVTLSPGPNTIIYDHALPHCSSCSGLIAGTYQVDAALARNGVVVSNMTRSFKLEQ